MTRLSILLAIVCLAGCADPARPLEIPRPDLTGAEAEVVEAITQSHREIEADAGSADAWGRLGDRYRAGGWSEEAAACYAEAERIAPESFRWPHVIGVSLLRSNPEVASEAFARALAIDPAYTPARVLRARTLVGMGRTSDAREQLELVIDREPNNAHAISALGQLLVSEGDFEGARDHLEQAAAIDPAMGPTRRALAQVYQALGDAKRAAREATLAESLRYDAELPDPRAAFQVPPAGTSAHVRAGLDLMARGLLPDAVAEFEEALTGDADNLSARFNLAVALGQLGRKEESVEQFREVLRIDPDDAQAHLMLGLTLSGLRRFDEAVEAWREAARLDPDSVEAHAALGEYLWIVGRVREGVPHLEAVARLDPSRTDMTRLLAWVRSTDPDVALRDGDEAVRLAEQAVKSAGRPHPVLLDTLAAAYAEAGRFEDASRVVSQALELARVAASDDLTRSLRERSELYKQRKAYRDRRSIPDPSR